MNKFKLVGLFLSIIFVILPFVVSAQSTAGTNTIYTTISNMLNIINSLTAKYAALNKAVNSGNRSFGQSISGSNMGTNNTNNIVNTNTGAACVSAPAISIGTSSSLPTSARYVRINTNNKDWVSWLEVEAYDQNNQKITPVSATANRVYDGNSPFAIKTSPAVASYAIDSNQYTGWNSGVNCDKKAWLQVDYGSAKQISNIKLLVNGLGIDIVHEVLVSEDGQNFHLVKTFKGTEDEPIENSEWLDVKNDPRSLPKVAPTITQLKPNSGKPGTTFEIIGTGFTYRNNAIAFGPTIGHVRMYAGANRNNTAGTSVYGMASYDMYYTFGTGALIPLDCLSVDPTCVAKYSTAISMPIKPGTYNVAVKTAYGTSNSLPFTVTQ